MRITGTGRGTRADSCRAPRPASRASRFLLFLFWIYMDRGDQNMVFYKDNGFIQCVEELKSTMIEKMIEEMVMTAFFYKNVLIALA